MDFNHVYALHHLLANRRTPIALNDILNKLEVQKATFHRIRAFMVDSLNAPIKNEKGQGYYYGRVLGHAPYELPGLWFTAQELTALSLLEQLLEASQPALLSQLLKPVKDKMTELMADQGIDQAQYQQRLRILPQWQRPCDPITFTRLSQALLQRKQLQIHYQSRGTNATQARTLSPQRLVYYRDNWYLDAWCHLRNDLRTFAIDQIQQISDSNDTDAPDKVTTDNTKATNDGAKNTTDGTKEADRRAIDIQTDALDTHYRSSYGIFAGQAQHTAELEFTPRIATWVSREQWHPDQTDQWHQNGHYRLKVPYNNPTELILDILRYGAEVQVLGPASLRQAVKQRLTDALKQYL